MGMAQRMVKLLWFLAALAAVAIGVGLALWRAPHSVDLPVDDSPVSGTPPAPMPAPPTLAQAAPEPASPPPGLNAEQWVSLRRELAHRPDELRRVVDYLSFSDRLQHFRDGTAADRKALAAVIDRSINERLRQRELGAGEARLIKIAVLQELLPDETQREAALQAWETAQRAAAKPDLAVAAREADFQRRQAEIVAAWQAQPARQRDPQALERELEALRLSSFSTTPR
jgi:hypothetical protein